MKNAMKYNLFAKRLLDIILASLGILTFIIPLLILGLMIKIASGGPVIHWTERIGLNKKRFLMAKLRTMKNDTPQLSCTHLKNPGCYFICFGKFLREYGIDELPQLYNILKGDMSMVGPRPVIMDDARLIELRSIKNIHQLKPGLTGLAQIKSSKYSDESTKVKYDENYLNNISFMLDIRILLETNYYLFRRNFIDKPKRNPEISSYKEPIFSAGLHHLET
jgi:O-antigen biosynthesis protein WbqP